MILRTGTILVLWLLLSIPSAGLLASALGYPAVWGNHGSVIADFLLPFPADLGWLHIPSMLAFAFLLVGQSGWNTSHRRLFRLGASIAAVVALLIILGIDPASRATPAPSAQAVVLLFLLSDATVALVVSMLVPGLDLDRARPEDGHKKSAAWPYVTGLGILAVSVMLLHQFHILSLPL
jgi:hypothetical protein